MKVLNFLDKLKIILEETKNNKMIVIILLAILLNALFYLFSFKKNENKIKIINIITYLLISSVVIVIYRNHIFSLFVLAKNAIFDFLYTPNMSSYFLTIVILNIIMANTLITKRKPFYYKVVINTIYSLNTYIFIIVLNFMKLNNMKLMDNIIRSSTKLNGLMSLSNILFILLIIHLILYKIAVLLTLKKKKIKVKEVVKEPQFTKKEYELILSLLKNNK